MGHRFFGALLATLFAATGIASADCYVYGKDGLRPWDSNKCHEISGGFRCPSVSTGVSFRDPKSEREVGRLPAARHRVGAARRA